QKRCFGKPVPLSRGDAINLYYLPESSTAQIEQGIWALITSARGFGQIASTLLFAGAHNKVSQ
ncbi:MAG: hypothetical protein WD038_03170, partial [Balneolales bacterium]